jgi:hypothetical protein
MVTLFRVPRDLQRCNAVEDLVSIIGITGLAIFEMAVWDRVTQNVEVILIFEYRLHSFCGPDIDHSVSDHAGITAGTRCAERVRMVDVELICTTL